LLQRQHGIECLDHCRVGQQLLQFLGSGTLTGSHPRHAGFQRVRGVDHDFSRNSVTDLPGDGLGFFAEDTAVLVV
jgi:hypothetical protein